jgi:hypothetical protein
MISWPEYNQLPLEDRISMLYERGTFVMSIRYYGYKINLYLMGNLYLEVFVNHKLSSIEKIVLLNTNHTRMKFYSDQIKLPDILHK